MSTSENGTARTCLLAAYALDRACYAGLLRDQLCWPVEQETDFAPTAVWAALRTRPGVVVVVADRPTRDVCDALEMVRRLQPSARILVVCGVREPGQLDGWSRCELHGFLSKQAPVAELLAALRAVAGGELHFAAEVRDQLERARQRESDTSRLSRREEELLQLLAQGMTLRDAAQVLSISYKTADSYRSNVLKKLNLRDRHELLRYAIRKGMVDP